ncbi:MAG: FIST N-terminal domain-containing protein [Polyangiales bacterium]
MSTRRDALGAGREAVEQACAGLARAPDFLLVFGTSGYDPAELLAGIRGACPAPLGGCSGEGIIAGDLSCERPRAVTVLAVCSDTLRFEAHLLPGYGDDSAKAGATLAAALGGRDDLAGLLVFPDGLLGDCERFLTALHEGLPEEARAVIVGGAAGDAMELRQTWQYRDDVALHGALCAVAIFGPARLAVEVSHGCEAVGGPMRITRAEGPWLHELDARPALSVFEEYLAGGADALTEEGIAHLGLGEVSPDAPDVLEVIHTPHRFDRENGAMGFPGGGLQPGPVRMVRRDAEAVRSSTVQCARRLREALGAQPPAFVLQFDCAGRGQTLFGPETSDAIVRPLREAIGGDAAWVGFHSYGEIAPVRGRARYHNYTVALCALCDA